MTDIPNRTYVVEGRKPRPAVVKDVGELIDAAKDNDFDLLAPGAMTDHEIAGDIISCTGGLEGVSDEELEAAVAAVRAERA